MLDLGFAVVAVLRTAVDEGTARDAGGCAAGVVVVVDSDVASDIFRGDLGLDVAAPFPLALKKGEAVLLIPGVPVREGGLLGLLIEGLSHDVKKSSLGSPAGVCVPVPSLSSPRSSTVTSSGNLYPN
jgi:hypothetical protein